MITDLGRAAIEMPVDLKLVKLLMLGRAFGALNECIVMATAVSMVDIFMQPSQVGRSDVNVLSRIACLPRRCICPRSDG